MIGTLITAGGLLTYLRLRNRPVGLRLVEASERTR